MSNPVYLYHLASNLTTTEGPASIYGKTGGIQAYTTTTETADEIYIGYKGVDSHNNLIVSPWDGDFERDSDDGRAVWTLDTAGGDDKVRLREDQNAYTVAKFGTGDDVYHIGGKLDANLYEAQNNDDARAYVFMEEGNDTVIVDNTVDGGRIFAGAGSDNITIHGEVDDGGVIDLGSGDVDTNNSYANGHIEARSADSAEDVNNLHITGSLGESANNDFGMVIGGAGQDNVVIDHEIEGISRVDLGDNNDSVSVSFMEHNSAIITGNDDDTVNVKSSLFHNSSINTAGEVVEGTSGYYITYLDPITEQMVTEYVEGTKGRTDDDIVKVGYSTTGTSSIEVGDGVNRIEIGDDVDDYSSISAGKHEDTLIIGDDVENKATINLGEGDNRIEVGSQVGGESTITTGSGNDVMTVGYAIATRAHVDLGDGDNSITVGDDIDGYTKVMTGSGNDTLIIGDDTEDGAVINLGDGNNRIDIASTIEDRSSITTGSGNDSLTVGYAIADHSTVDLGDGDNVITVGDDVDGYTKVSTGSGNDTINVGDDTEDGSVINLGDGNNTVNIADAVEDSSAIITGSGNDSITVGDRIETGAKISAGSGQDTLELTFNDNDYMVSSWTHVTNLSTESLSGVEKIIMSGKNAVDIRFEDLLNDTSRDGALFINGNSDSKVDLGSTNWNSDNETRASMKDSTGGQWSQSGTETVDGTIYDVYHNSLATDTSNDVYIEQGIVVI